MLQVPLVVSPILTTAGIFFSSLWVVQFKVRTFNVNGTCRTNIDVTAADLDVGISCYVAQLRRAG